MSSIDDNLDIELSETQKKHILNNLDENDKLSCLKAFKVAKLLKIEPYKMSAITKSVSIKITDCELGVFGNLEFKNANANILNTLYESCSDNKIDCKNAWKIAQKFSLKEVGSTIKNSPLEVVYCQLGCFRERKGNK